MSWTFFFSYISRFVRLPCLFICFLFCLFFYLSARFDASRAHASALVHFTEVHSFLVVYRPVNLTVFSVSKRRRKQINTFYSLQYHTNHRSMTVIFLKHEEKRTNEKKIKIIIMIISSRTKPAIAVMTGAIFGVRFTLAENVLPQMAQLATQRGIGQPVKERVHHARHFGENRREDVPFWTYNNRPYRP